MTKAEENENKIVARRYVDAIFEFADDKYTKETILSELSDVLISLENSDELQKVMSSPVIPDDDKKQVIDKVFSKANINKTILNFLKLLVDKKRFNILGSIVKEGKSEINKEKNRLDLRVTSAIDLTDSEKSEIKTRLQEVLKKEVDLEWEVNNEIIAGLMFETNDNIIDCSLLHKLQVITKEMIK